MKQLVLSIVCLFLGVSVFAGNPDYTFMRVSSKTGLSSSMVKAIVQDSYGFVWFGTKNGLNRYDGTDIRTFNCYDFSINQGNNNIGALYEDRHRRLWVGTDRGVYVYDPPTDRFTKMTARDVRTAIGADNWVQTIVGDPMGNIWVLLPDEGIFRYHGDKVSHYRGERKKNTKKVHPAQICIDKKGNVWTCSTSGGIYKYNRQGDSFDMVCATDIPFNTMCVAKDGSLLLGDYYCHLYRYDPATSHFSALKRKLSVGNTYLHDLKCFDDELWVGTSNGIFLIDLTTMEETHLTEDPSNPYSLSDNLIYTIYRSPDNDVWVGTYFGGVDYMQRSRFMFTVCGIQSNLLHKRLRNMAFAPDGRLWIGSEFTGAYIYNPATDEAVPNPYGQGNAVLMVSRSGDDICVGYARQGIDAISPSGTVRKLFYIANGSDNSVYSYLRDSRNCEWVGLGWALYRRKAGEGDFHLVADTGYDWIFTIFEAHDGTIWMGTMGNGIWHYTPTNGKYKKYEYRENGSNGLRSNSVSSIMEDSRGNLWFSTDRGGISRYNPQTDDFTSFGTAEGLPDNTAYDILEDKNGFFWFGTNKGLVKFNPQTGESLVYTTHDGLVGNQFNYNTAVKTPDGRFYFGGINGLIAFSPEAERQTGQVRPAFFTNLTVLGKEVTATTPNSPLKTNIAFTDRIELPYNCANFSISVAAPNYGATGSVELMYRLEPVGREWLRLNDSDVSFANLSPGHYNLQVKVRHNNTEQISELAIVILPPWWQTWWAYMLYALLVVAVLATAFCAYRRRKQRQVAEAQRLYAVEKEKELYQSKVQMFTTIAHEIRTPLSLIDSPLEAIEEIGVKDGRAKRYLKIVRQNTQRLLYLTSQLLDFQKLDSNNLRLNKENLDVTELVSETLERFEPSIQLKNKRLERMLPDHPVVAFVDREALTKIISNLMNNALKYSRSLIIVSLTDDGQEFCLRVTSDGVAITGNDRQRIFEPFYQIGNDARSNGGVGIGLPLCRQLAQQSGGTLTLDEEHGSGENTFELRLPLDKAGMEQWQLSTVNSQLSTVNFLMDEESNQTREGTKGNTLLIVEDNDELRTFLAEQLSCTFTIETAVNGQAALEKLTDINPDLIVTDIMMPEMDGYALCRAVKADINISHIPVIVITAKNDLQSKVKILQCGAEAYIEKPFSVKYLRQLTLSMLDNRRREREAFSKKPFFKVDNMQMNKADKEFMEKVIRLIEDNIVDEDFNVDAMAEMMCMSRSTLLRKIKTIFNLSTVELIRLVKLKKAAELIQEGEHLIGDICYMVGIASPSYFAKIFFRQFGIMPKDFEKNCQEQGRKTLTINNNGLKIED